MTGTPVQFHAAARQELRAAARWYENEQPGLGDDFVASVEAALQSIAATPETWPLWQGVDVRIPIRRRLTKRFPFAIGYVVRDSDIVIVAVAHTKRRPGYWAQRLGSLPPPT